MTLLWRDEAEEGSDPRGDAVAAATIFLVGLFWMLVFGAVALWWGR